MKRRNGCIFIDAAGGDIQEDVVRRAARIAIENNREVFYNIINRSEDAKLTVEDAKKIMTAKMWVEELRHPLSEPLSRKEANQMTKKMKMEIIKQLKKEWMKLHSHCLDLTKKNIKIIKSLNII